VNPHRLRFLLALACWLLPGFAIADGTEELQRELARGLLLVETGKYPEALATLRKAFGLDPQRRDILLRIAVLQAKMGDDEGAAAALKRILADDPQHADALRELGALYILKRRADEAAPLLQRATTVNPKDGAARYYLGLAFHATGRDAAARRSLVLAARISPELRSQAAYYLGLSFLLARDAIHARDALEYSVQAASDLEYAELSKKTLSELAERLGKRPKRWDLYVSIGAAYDSNVSMLPDLSGDLPLPPGITLVSADSSVTTAAAARLFTEIGFEARPIAGPHTLGIGGTFYQSKHLPEKVAGAFDPPSFDMTAFGFYAYYALASRLWSKPFRLELTAGYSEILLDTFRSPRHYLQNPWVRSSLALTETDWAATRLSYRLSVENYLTGNPENTADDRDGFEHLVTLEQFFFLGTRFDFRVSAFAGTFGADGNQWDAIMTGGSVDAQIRILNVLALWVGIDYLHRDFIHSSYTITGLDLQTREVQRVDDRFAAFGRFQIELSPINIGVLYTFMRNISSARQLFSYTRHLAGVEIGFRY
jgi:tetratricopeptide (TPR) repeat protein